MLGVILIQVFLSMILTHIVIGAAQKNEPLSTGEPGKTIHYTFAWSLLMAILAAFCWGVFFIVRAVT